MKARRKKALALQAAWWSSMTVMTAIVGAGLVVGTVIKKIELAIEMERDRKAAASDD